MWAELDKVKSENRHELVLNSSIEERISGEKELKEFFQKVSELNSLNFLDISGVKNIGNLGSIQVDALVNLTTLILRNDGIISGSMVPVSNLSKLKVLDLSFNEISGEIPQEFGKLEKLTTLNLSVNCIEKMPDLLHVPNLSCINLSSNKLMSLDFLVNGESPPPLLAEVLLNKNQIEECTHKIGTLTALKKFDLSDNSLKSIPGELASCLKIKELSLQNNPISDNRLKKLVHQKGHKAILDYVRTHCPKQDSGSGGTSGGGKKGKKGKKGKGTKEEVENGDDVEDELASGIQVLRIEESACLNIAMDVEALKDVRPFFVACVVRDVDLKTEGNLKKFLNIQTKLHDGVCDKRNAATIATHDLKKIAQEGKNLLYTAKEPELLKIKPLGQSKEFIGKELVQHLNKEAEHIRKEKKRNSISGIHQYLHIVNKLTMYACLFDSEENIISFPPITNGDSTKLSEDSTDVLLEVSSGLKWVHAKTVIDSLIKEMFQNNLMKAEDKKLKIEQVKVVDLDGNLKVVYPSKNDLNFDDVVVKRN